MSNSAIPSWKVFCLTTLFYIFSSKRLGVTFLIDKASGDSLQGFFRTHNTSNWLQFKLYNEQFARAYCL